MGFRAGAISLAGGWHPCRRIPALTFRSLPGQEPGRAPDHLQPQSGLRRTSEIRHAADCPNPESSCRNRSALQEPHAHVKAAEEDHRDERNQTPPEIPLGLVDTLIFPDSICEAVEHTNLLKGRL